MHDLAKLGVTPDDIAVVSKHDTSTNANDPNESELHNTLAHAIGRTDGNPLFVISQKSLTGHAKGGACIFQVNGLTSCSSLASFRRTRPSTASTRSSSATTTWSGCASR